MKDTARFFKVLADEARLNMLWLLLNNRELCVCDFMEVLDITQSKASRHLAALRNAGLASDRKEGLWSYYSLRRTDNELVAAHLRLLRENLSKRTEAKQLLARLNSWLKTKNTSASCCRSGDKIRKTASTANVSARTHLSRGIR